MTDEQKPNNFLLLAIVGSAVGLLFIGQQQFAKNAASNTANLPATNANVKTNADNIKSNSNSFRDELDKQNQRLASSISSQVQLIRDEINRREVEQVKYIDTLDAKQQDAIKELRKLVLQLTNRFDEHQNTPTAKHKH